MGTEEANSEIKEVETLSDLDKNIVRQIEYYFGNYNLSRDKFLKELIKVDDGWVSLEKLILFNRLKRLTEDFNVITQALKKSSKLMEVHEDGNKIRRKIEKPLPDAESFEARRDAMDERSLYVKGFHKDSTLDDLLEYFKDYNAEHITMRRKYKIPNKPFKGSVFVMFETKTDADKFLSLKDIKFKKTNLLRERKNDYVKRKDELFEQLKEQRANKKVTKDTKETAEVPEVPSYEKGCLLKLAGLPKQTLREDIKTVADTYGTVVYVDYSRGQPTAVVRYETGIVPNLVEKLPDGHIEVKKCKASVSCIEGEAEAEYWKQLVIGRSMKRRDNKGRFSKKRRYRNEETGYGAKRFKSDYNAVKDNKDAVQDNKDVVMDNKDAVQDSNDAAQDNSNTVKGNNDVALDKNHVNDTTVKDNNDAVKDNIGENAADKE